MYTKGMNVKGLLARHTRERRKVRAYRARPMEHAAARILSQLERYMALDTPRRELVGRVSPLYGGGRDILFFPVAHLMDFEPLPEQIALGSSTIISGIGGFSFARLVVRRDHRARCWSPPIVLW